MEGSGNAQGPPTPDPALSALDPFVGTWDMKGHLIGSDEENVVGQATFRWLDGGFFLLQEIELDFAGMFEVKSHELVGYDPEAEAFSSLVFSNLAPSPLPYRWEVDGRAVTIKVNYGPLNATFNGEMSEDGNTFSGGWRANPGADETVNVPYDIAGTRVQ
jgi:hypothetical protein